MSRLAKLIGALVAMALMFPVIAVIAYIAAPQMEGLLFPVFKANMIAGSTVRTDNEVCWSIQFYKYRRATPVYTQMVLIDDSVRIPVVGYKADGTLLSLYSFANHAPGDSWVSRYCVQTPEVIPDSHTIVIEGEAVYDVWHHLWRPKQQLPSLLVPGMTSN